MKTFTIYYLAQHHHLVKFGCVHAYFNILCEPTGYNTKMGTDKLNGTKGIPLLGISLK